MTHEFHAHTKACALRQQQGSEASAQCVPAQLRFADSGLFDRWSHIPLPERTGPEWLLAEVELGGKDPVIGGGEIGLPLPAFERLLRNREGSS